MGDGRCGGKMGGGKMRDAADVWIISSGGSGGSGVSDNTGGRGRKGRWGGKGSSEGSGSNGSGSKAEEKISVLVEYDRGARRDECPSFFQLPLHSMRQRVTDYLVSRLSDHRDEVMAQLIACICMTTVPAACFVFAVQPLIRAWTCVQSNDTLYFTNANVDTKLMHLVGVIYVTLNSLVYTQRFALTLHYSEHRGLWRKEAQTARTDANICLDSRACAWLSGLEFTLLRCLVPMLCPLFGIPPGIYRLHHCVMHHVENNGNNDYSGTGQFTRNSPLHFFGYYLKMIVGILALPIYAIRLRRYELALRSGLSFMLYGSAVAMLYNNVDALATTYVFLVPLIIMTIALSFGNWSQHIFINHDFYGQAPEEKLNRNTIDSYCMAYNCIATPENQKTYNDGYHTVHHANSRLHWSEMPSGFLKSLELQRKYQTINFQGIHFMDVGFACTFCGEKGLQWLATKYVELNDDGDANHRCTTSVDDRRKAIVNMLRQRLKPITF